MYTMLMRREFCYAIKEKYPSCLIQFEDFQTDMVRALVPAHLRALSLRPSLDHSRDTNLLHRPNEH